jgi:Ca2+/Na+ antiporter
MSSIVISTVLAVILMIQVIRDKDYIWLLCLVPFACLIVLSLTDILDFIPSWAVSLSFYIIGILTFYLCAYYGLKKHNKENADDSSD